MLWFRFYSEALNNPKVQCLPPDVFKTWVNLLCLTSQKEGPLDAMHAPFCLRLDKDIAHSHIEILIAANLMVEVKGGLLPHDWDLLQFKSDTSKERTKRYRDNRKNLGLSTMGDYSKFKRPLIERDGPNCVYCGSSKKICVDHMTPIKLGGGDDLDNLALACKECNSGKAGRTPEQAGYTFKSQTASMAYERYKNKPVTVTQTAPSVSVSVSVSESVSSRKGDARGKPKKPDDVTQETWDEWVLIRKNKKHVVSDNAISKTRKQGESLGWTLQQTLEKCCEKDWSNFNAGWILKEQRNETTIGTVKKSKRERFAESLDEGLAEIAAERQTNLLIGPAKL